MRYLRQIISAALALLLSQATGASPGPDYAPIMPRAAQSLLLDIAAKRGRMLAVGERGHILFSGDSGHNWSQARVPTTQMLTAVHIGQQRSWAVGHDGLILASDDGGENWRIQRDGLAIQAQLNIEAREQALADLSVLQAQLAQNPDDRSLQLELEEAQLNLQDAETALAEPVFTAPLLDIWFSDRQRGWATGAFGLLLHSTDGGRHWTDVRSQLDNPDEFHLNAITGDRRGRLLIAAEGGLLFRSLDNGHSWHSLASPYQGSWFGALYSPLHDSLLVYGLRGTLYRSTNFGDSWQRIEHQANSTLAGGAVTAAGDIYLVGAVGLVLHSSDGGNSFNRHRTSRGRSLSAVGGEEPLLVGQGGITTLPQDTAP